MDQAALNFNPPPMPGELFKYGSQQYRIYEKLVSGGATSVEIQEIGCLSHTRRISDIREKLKPYLLDVKAERKQGSVYFYHLKGINN
jgi:hypothetical protein